MLTRLNVGRIYSADSRVEHDRGEQLTQKVAADDLADSDVDHHHPDRYIDAVTRRPKVQVLPPQPRTQSLEPSNTKGFSDFAALGDFTPGGQTLSNLLFHGVMCRFHEIRYDTV